MLNKKAFTLVELIVVITILSILGTISFLSVRTYVEDSRNSHRVADVSTIKNSLEIFKTTIGFYPQPDNPDVVTYSGGVLWNQGTFGNTVFTNVSNISKVPVDPLIGTQYAYSTSGNALAYQIATVFEGGGISYNLVPQSYAASVISSPSPYISGNYSGFDLAVKIGDECRIIAIPSLMLHSIPSGGTLETGTGYHFSSNNAGNIPKLYSDSVSGGFLGREFKISEVYNKCQIDSVSDLDLYITQLSIAYQQFNGDSEYEDVIFHSNTPGFKEFAAYNIRDIGLGLSDNIITDIRNQVIKYTYIDSFMDTAATPITSHTSTGGTWQNIGGGYQIGGDDTLEKTDTGTGFVYPSVAPAIGSSDMEVSFDIIDFGGDEITTYLRYIDDDNYYSAQISQTGYSLIRKVNGSEIIRTVGTHSFNSGDTVKYVIVGGSKALYINGVLKDSVLDDSLNAITSVGNPVLLLKGLGAKIDNYSLTYQ